MFIPLSAFYVSQILVGLAIVLDVLSFQLKKREHILLCLSFAAVFIALHFMLLGKWTAAVLMAMAVLRYAISYYIASMKLMFLFTVAAVISTVFTFQGMLSLLSCCGSVFQTLGAFSADDKKLRQLMIIGTLFWLLHNILAGSPGAVIMEILFLSSNLLAYYRFYISRSKVV